MEDRLSELFKDVDISEINVEDLDDVDGTDLEIKKLLESLNEYSKKIVSLEEIIEESFNRVSTDKGKTY
jgi:hypothetical protein